MPGDVSGGSLKLGDGNMKMELLMESHITHLGYHK